MKCHLYLKTASIGLLSVFLILFQACQAPEWVDKDNDPLSTVLGERPKTNPFAVETVNQAIKNVAARKIAKGGRVSACLSVSDCGASTTHNYVRFAPQNVDQLLTLHNYGYDLYDVPLDVEVTTQGEYYHDPALPSSAITYQYTLVPVNYSLPTTVPYNIISQVLLFDETAGDEADEPDPWVPDPDPGSGSGYCYDEYGQAYVCNTDPRIYLRKNTSLPEDLYKKATQRLIDSGIDLVELYNEALHLAGMDDEMITDPKTGGRVAGYTPSGTVKVRDNVTGLDVPVKNVTVKTRRFFKIDEALTNASGNFAISKSYRQKAHVVLKFRNGGMKVRGISGLLKIWEYAQVLERELGLFEQNQLTNMNIVIPYSTNADTHTALAWAGAHCLNTYFESKQFSTTNNIIHPYNGMNVWISSAITQSASAPMLRALATTSEVNQAINYLLPGVASTIKRIVENFVPDVTLRLQAANGNTGDADDLSNTFFHEFGHSQHYQQVGNGYWAVEIGYTVLNGGYGNKTTAGSGRPAVVESWGYFIGNTFNRTKYATVGTATANAISLTEGRALENQRRDDTVPFAFDGTNSRGWIPQGMLHDCIDVGEPTSTGINDLASGYTINMLFKGYTASATTVQTLRANILSNNANSQATQINNLVTSYGW